VDQLPFCNHPVPVVQFATSSGGRVLDHTGRNPSVHPDVAVWCRSEALDVVDGDDDLVDDELNVGVVGTVEFGFVVVGVVVSVEVMEADLLCLNAGVDDVDTVRPVGQLMILVGISMVVG